MLRLLSGGGTSIQDTAMAISALDGDTIEKRGLVGMDDYLRTLPGVSMQDRGAGQNSIVIRGLRPIHRLKSQQRVRILVKRHYLVWGPQVRR